MLSREQLAELKADMNGSPLMENRNKVSWKDLEGADITIEDLQQIGEGEDSYYVINCKEYPDSYMFTGSQLTKAINKYGRDIIGTKFTVGKEIRTKNGNNFIPFTVC